MVKDFRILATLRSYRTFAVSPPQNITLNQTTVSLVMLIVYVIIFKGTSN